MSNYAELIDKLKTAMEVGSEFERQCEVYRARIQTLQAENAKLRRRLREKSREARVLESALNAALYLVTLHTAGCSTSRAAAVADGIPERAWHWGRALLMAARVHDGRAITTFNIDELSTALSGTVQRIEKQGFYAMRARNAKHRLDKEQYRVTDR